MSNQVWESWRDDRLANLTQERDELLALAREAQPIVWQWEKRVYHGKTDLADRMSAAIARAEHNEGVK